MESGLICPGSVGIHQMPMTAVTESMNFEFDSIGSARLRRGSTSLGTGLAASNILGLYEFNDDPGTYHRLVCVNGTVLYYLSGTTWTSKRTGLTASKKSRFTTFLNFLWMVNGTDATAIWDGQAGNSFVTTGNASSAPVGKFIEVFRARVWVAGNATYPDRVYFSSLPSAVTTPVVTWNTAVDTGDWIDISPSDGENITALKRMQASLLVFKNNHIYRIYSYTDIEPDAKINVGTYSQESVVETKTGIYFHHPSGFYRYYDGVASEVSKNIQDIVDAISSANYGDVAGWTDGDHVYWSVGDVTLGDVTYSNMVVRYTISSQAWTFYTYPYQYLCSSNYDDGTTLFRLAGNTNGEVNKINVGTSDNSTAIPYSLTHRWYTIDGLSNTRKTITEMLFDHEKGMGTNVHYQREGMADNEWLPIGQLSDVDTIFSNEQIRGRKLRFRISGSSIGQPFEYRGFEVLSAISEKINI